MAVDNSITKFQGKGEYMRFKEFCITIAPGVPLLPLNPCSPAGPPFPGDPGGPGSP